MVKTERHWYWIAVALWLIPAIVIVIMVIDHPLERSMTPIYHKAVANWWALQPVYTGSKGFNYLPVFLPVFGVFAGLPIVVGEILWRLVALIGLGFGLWRCVSLATASNYYRAFVIVTVLSLPICISALRNGQSSAQLAACLVLATWCLHKQRWWWATLWLSLSLVCKPLGIPAIGLAVMAFPRLWWRMIAGVGVVAIAPYFLAPASYVNNLYVAFAVNVTDCLDPGGPGGRTFADLNGVLAVLNLRLTGMASVIASVAAGVAMAFACWFLSRLGNDFRRTLLWLGFSGCYIMLFTPMNEGNSYVMLAPALGLWAYRHIENRETRLGYCIAAMSIMMVFLPDIIGLVLGRHSGNEFAKFLYPLITLIFLGTLVSQMNQAFTESRQRHADPG